MGRITMVTSGRDGVGKTISSVLLADALAERGARVLVVELDSQLRSIDVAAGVTGITVFDILDLLSGRCPTEKAIIKVQKALGYEIATGVASPALQCFLFSDRCSKDTFKK